MDKVPEPIRRSDSPSRSAGENRGVSVGRDSSGNAFVTGDNNQVKVVIYQSVTERRETEVFSSSAIGPNPYMGLLAFHEEDADRFFGRAQQIERLWNALHELCQGVANGKTPIRLLPILGPSGSGKSSLARAGLIPELARRPLPGCRSVRVAVVTPGSRPLESLASVLARIATGDPAPVEKTREFERVLQTRDTDEFGGLRRIAAALRDVANNPLIVLVDQFEEIYSLCDDKMVRTKFIENLLSAARDGSGHATIILTLRTDFVGETQTHELLNQAICANQVMVPAMSEAELRQAITKPAEVAGGHIDDSTVTLLINETKDRAGALPLLQFTLMRIWEGLKRNVTPATTLIEIGGVGGALAGEAQRIFDRLDDEQKRIAKRVFLGLVQLGEGTRDTRRRAAFESLVGSEDREQDVEQVINRFSERTSRLITLSGDDLGTGRTAEVTHEALFDHWKLLNQWLSENREDIRLQRRLEQQSQLWNLERSKPNGQPDGLLWRPPELTLLQSFRERSPIKMTRLQTSFYFASDAAENERVHRERRRKRILQVGIVVLSTLFVIATALGWFAMVSRNEAITARNETIDAQIDNLQTAAPAAVVSILENLERMAASDDRVVRAMEQKLASLKSTSSATRLRLGLLTVGSQVEQIVPLREHMLQPYLNLDEYLLHREQLGKFPDQMKVKELWNNLSELAVEPELWMRHIGALSRLDLANERWKEIGADVAEQLVRRDPADLAKWIAVLKPVHQHLLPRLKEIYATQESDRLSTRPNAALALADYLQHDQSSLLQLLIDYADTPQTFRPLVFRLPKAQLGIARNFLSDENVARTELIHVIDEVLKETVTSYIENSPLKGGRPEDLQLIRRRANAATILLFIGESDKFWPLLNPLVDVTLSTNLIHRLNRLGVEPERIYPKLFDGSQPPAIEQALILALGEYPPHLLSLGDLTACAKHLLIRFKDDPDSGIHSAAEWTIGEWARDPRAQQFMSQVQNEKDAWSSKGLPHSETRRWYLNSVQQTMVLIEAHGAWIDVAPMGQRIPPESVWRYAMSATEVSDPEFRRCLLDKEQLKRMGLFHPDEITTAHSKSACEVNWYHAAAYCNWLTEQELGPKDAAAELCYLPNDAGRYEEGMKIHPEYLLRKGFRLPTEAEWEFACVGPYVLHQRESALATEWSFGNAEEFLGKYAQHRNESRVLARPALLKPNGFGLFDMYGNVAEWCQEMYRERRQNGPEVLVVSGESPRVLRGGALNFDLVQGARTVSRKGENPNEKFSHGFRIVKSLR